jgi:hypothetical protein
MPLIVTLNEGGFTMKYTPTATQAAKASSRTPATLLGFFFWAL